MSPRIRQATGPVEADPESTSPTNPIGDWVRRLVLLLLVATTTYPSAARVWRDTELPRVNSRPDLYHPESGGSVPLGLAEVVAW
ncbi:MAG TPA: hypothetical protein VGN26_04395 [Armatimonadota bacterium]|jgi:hypothetical protein